MKKLLIILISALSLAAMADEMKLALLQPLTVPGSTECNPMEISMVRGELRKAFGWQSNFQVLTRLDVDAMLKEQGFQRSGMVDDAQRKQVGVMTGAQYICVSTITKYNTQLYIEAYLVDVETGQMTNPATQYVNVKNEDYSTLPKACEELAKEMLGEIADTPKRTSKTGVVLGGHQVIKKDFTETAFSINMKMIWVEGGEFMMGCTSEQGDDCYDNEKNVRRVTVDGFYIGMLEVTQSQWEKVMGSSLETQEKNPGNTGETTIYNGPNYPMYCVTWDEAMTFCRILSNKTGKIYSLPTEAQWEYAARGGKNEDGTKYSGSNRINEVAWYKKDDSKLHPCGTKKANTLGIYDMSGNVSEWCKDFWHKTYINYDTNNPQGPITGSHHVVRGGEWNNDERECRVSNRSYILSGNHNYTLGFRVVCITDAHLLIPIKKDKLASQGYIDLDLPSGTLWKDVNEQEFFDAHEKENRFGNNVPSKNQWDELVANCKWLWKDNGFLITGNNGNSIFLPANGIISCGEKKEKDIYGYYYTSSYYSQPFKDKEGRQGWSPHYYIFEFDEHQKNTADWLSGFLFEKKIPVRLIKNIEDY